MNLLEKAYAAMPELKLGVGTNMKLEDVVQLAANWVGIIAGVLAFFFLVYSGILYLTAGGNAEATKKGQQGLLNAIIGLVIISIAWGVTTALVGQLSSGR